MTLKKTLHRLSTTETRFLEMVNDQLCSAESYCCEYIEKCVYGLQKSPFSFSYSFTKNRSLSILQDRGGRLEYDQKLRISSTLSVKSDKTTFSKAQLLVINFHLNNVTFKNWKCPFSFLFFETQKFI